MTIPPIAHGRAIANVLRGDGDESGVGNVEDFDDDGDIEDDGVTINVFTH